MWTDRNSLSSVFCGVVIILVSWFAPAGGSLIAALADWKQGISIDDGLKMYPEFMLLKTLSGIWGTLGFYVIIAYSFIFTAGLALDLHDILTDPYRRLQWFAPLCIFLIFPIFNAYRARVRLPRYRIASLKVRKLG
ncbi:hypothetical protein [Haloparvum sp. PAK95]|uniref:hypothetical protein n=1 Tax=Haloparvum sp. PAK95 TaxID=3418962 RepID=UPI003D2F314D